MHGFDQHPRIREDSGLSFDDVLLVPQRGILAKRKDADISTRIWAYSDEEVSVPIISAPMPSVTEAKMADAMLLAGGQAVIHRFMSLDEQIGQFKKTWKNIIVAIGVKEGLEHFRQLRSAGVTRFCIDVAHGHHEAVGYLLDEINGYESSDVRDSCYVMVGNVATPEGAIFLAEHAADSIKVGIGPGAACRTREVTGFGVPQLTAIMDCAKALYEEGHDVPIIADGGIRNSGDIVKALAAGASAVMVGSLLAGADEAPKPGEYFGNASYRVNGHRAPEGVSGVVPATGPVENTIKELAWGIKSGISYAGATNIQELQENAEFIRVAPGVSQESAVRV